MKFSVIVPVHQGAHLLPRLFAALADQSAKAESLVVAETDPSLEVERLARAQGAVYVRVEPGRYDHAGTRSALARQAGTDVVVLLSQDAVPLGTDSLAELLAPLQQDSRVGASFGRQVAPAGAHPFVAMKRDFLYPAVSQVRGFEDRALLGFTTAFFSNAFAAWRREALEEVGYFGERRLMCEDVATAAALLLRGWKVAYRASARVEHANVQSQVQELKRYFDIGVCHARDEWIPTRFGHPRREGVRFVLYGARWLLARGHAARLPAFAALAAGKRLAYALGRHHRWLPKRFCPRLSSFPGWWRRG